MSSNKGWLNNIIEDFLGGEKKSPKKKKSGTVSSTKRKKDTNTSKNNNSKTVKSEKSNIKSAAKSSVAPSKTVESKTISRLESLPTFESIISNRFSDMDIGEEKRKDYVVLLASSAHNIVDIIRSTESFSNKGVDNNFLSIKRDLAAAGYKYRQYFFASRQMIGLIYDQKANDKDKAVENASELAKDFEKLLEQCVQDGVSDIHIEVRRDVANVRSRVNGMIAHRHEWSVKYARDLATVVYQVLAEEKDIAFVPTVPQDAVLDRHIPSGRVRVRLATAPAYPDGFDMVMRILPIGVATKLKRLEELGYLPDQSDEITRMTDKPVGAIIISGVTGSGKSTSMATILASQIRDYEGKIKVITVENPPENAIPGATQVPVVLSREGKNGGSPFAATIKAALRSDPDVLMIGEVRDDDSADLLVHATQSGHTTITTLHAPSAFSVPSRLRSLGITNDVLGSADFFSGLVYQTLVQVMCPHCKINYEEFKNRPNIKNKEKVVVERVAIISTEEERKNVYFRNHDGCKHCESGIAGRSVVAETVYPDEQMKAFFSETKDIDARNYFLKNGGKLVLDAGLEKVFNGEVDPIDLEKKVGRITDVLQFNEIRNSTNNKLEVDK